MTAHQTKPITHVHNLFILQYNTYHDIAVSPCPDPTLAHVHGLGAHSVKGWPEPYETMLVKLISSIIDGSFGCASDTCASSCAPPQSHLPLCISTCTHTCCALPTDALSPTSQPSALRGPHTARCPALSTVLLTALPPLPLPSVLHSHLPRPRCAFPTGTLVSVFASPASRP